MRIVHIATSDLSIRLLLLDQLRYLQQRGHEVLAIASSGPHTAAIREAGIAMTTVEMTRRVTPAHDARAFVRLAAILRAFDPNIIHTHTPKASLLGQYAALLAPRAKRVHTIHGLYVPRDAVGIRRAIHLTIERVTMLPAAVVLSQSQEDVDACRTLRLCRSDRIRFLGNGIDIERFRPPSDDERAAARATLGIGHAGPVIGAVGRLVKEKGYLEFFVAAKQILASRTDATFLVFGSSDTEKTDAIRPDHPGAIALGDRIRFMGHYQDMPTAYWAMDLLVHPSHREGFPRAPMEAAASGIPTVGANVRGTREAVFDGRNGTLIPVADADALADAVLRVLEIDPHPSAKRARALALEQFDQQRVFARVLSAYEDVAATDPRDP